MGSAFKFTCSQCGYEAEISGGADCGIEAATETMVCNACRALVDVLVASKNREIDHPHCPECHSGNVVKWDARRRPCPRCSGLMNQGDIAMFWD